MRTRFFLLSLGFVIAGLNAGCNILAPIAFIFSPEPTTRAAYALENRPTVVFVDDRQNLVTPASLRGVIADQVTQNLMVKNVVALAISPRDAEAVARRNDSSDELMSIAQIGRAVGAEQIVYVEMLEFREHLGRTNLRPRGRCRIRVIDAINDVRLYPSPDMQEEYHTLEVLMSAMSPEAYRSRATRNEVLHLLASEIGVRTAKLFYKHSSGKLGTNLNGG